MTSLEIALSEVINQVTAELANANFDKVAELIEICKGLHKAMGSVNPIKNSALANSLTQNEKDLCDNGRCIEAIKDYRNRNVVSLKEAKDAIDAYRASTMIKTAK